MRSIITYAILAALLFVNSIAADKTARKFGRDLKLSTADSLTVNITKFTNNGEYVTVSWQTNSTNPTDAIGVYLVTDYQNITQVVADRDPLKLKKTGGAASGSVTYVSKYFASDKSTSITIKSTLNSLVHK